MSQKHIFLGFEYAKKLIFPSILITLIQIFTLFPMKIEQVYSSKLYLIISQILRSLTGLFSCSVGDILYAIVILLVIFSILLWVKHVIKEKFSGQFIIISFLKLVKNLAWLYIWFNILWGFNYYRSGIAYRLKLTDENYAVEDLCTITDSLIARSNYYRRKISADTVLPEYYTKQILTKAAENYKTVAKEYPFLRYNYSSVKPSIYNSLAAYIGFTGYYNPFSGEAQLRTDVPKILLPYTASHEIAHQLGFASETEANFVGYLAASQSDDDYFKYSAYLDLYKYARVQLFMHNTFPSGDVRLDALVKGDIRMINRFFLKERNSIAPVSMSLYNAYLKANNQTNGVDSYDDVISFLIRYYKKTGKL